MKKKYRNFPLTKQVLMLPQFPLICDALPQVTQVKASQGLYEVFKIWVPAEGLFIDTELGCL